jgi:hypothetical protein
MSLLTDLSNQKIIKNTHSAKQIYFGSSWPVSLPHSGQTRWFWKISLPQFLQDWGFTSNLGLFET